MNPVEPTHSIGRLSRHALPLGGPERVDPDHHLWKNGRLFWVAFTVHLPGWQKERVRLSLGTADREEARRRRDSLFRDYPGLRGCTLSLRPGSSKQGRHGTSRSPSVAA